MKYRWQTKIGERWVAAMGVSFNPDDMVAGGLLDDVDVTVLSARAAIYDFNGTVPGGVTCIALTMATDDGEKHVEYLSAADTKNFVPSNDGKQLVQTGEKAALNNNTKFAQFLMSLIDAGYPKNLIGDDFSTLDGLKVHIKRAEAPKSWGNLPRQARPDGGQQRDPTTLKVTKLIAMPGEKKAGTGAKQAAGKTQTQTQAAKPNGGAGAPTSAPPASGTGISDDRIFELIQKALEQNGGQPMDIATLAPAVFAVAETTEKKAAVKRLNDSKLLVAGQMQGKLSWDGTSVGPAEAE
jgi:hypothetical protein